MKLKSQKASADMWWIIIGAVIALVVMIILMVLFTGKTGRLEGGLLSCTGKGGTCGTEGECTDQGGTVSSAFECPEGLHCCFSSKALKKVAGERCNSNEECSSGLCSGYSQFVSGTCAARPS